MLFARAKEMERGNASIEEARAKIVAQIEKLRSQTAAIHKKVVVREQSSKEWFERYRWFVTTDGLLAIGGRDASSNSALIRKHLTEHDIVFHAEVHGSPFFIVKNAAAPAQAGEIEPSLAQVAQATVRFSRAWKDGLSSADAYWVTAGADKKRRPDGAVSAKGIVCHRGQAQLPQGDRDQASNRSSAEIERQGNSGLRAGRGNKKTVARITRCSCRAGWTR